MDPRRQPHFSSRMVKLRISQALDALLQVLCWSGTKALEVLTTSDPPTMQIQCDQGKSPVQGFSIDANNALLWKGRPNFSACPATDTEYNIYVNPDFGQTKCFDVTLTASGCGSCSELPAVMETVTVTSMWTSMATVTSTTCVSEPNSPPTSTASPTFYTSVTATTGCHNCSASMSNSSTIYSASYAQSSSSAWYRGW
jgi:hypothetical protein